MGVVNSSKNLDRADYALFYGGSLLFRSEILNIQNGPPPLFLRSKDRLHRHTNVYLLGCDTTQVVNETAVRLINLYHGYQDRRWPAAAIQVLVT